MKKSSKAVLIEIVLVPIATVFIEIITTKIFDIKSLKEILLSTVLILIVFAILSVPITNLIYQINKVRCLFIENKKIKSEFRKHYDVICELSENGNYQEIRTMCKLDDCISYIFNLFLDKTENKLNDEIQKNLIENIKFTYIEDYLNMCKRILSEFDHYNMYASETISELSNKISIVEARIRLLGYKT